MIGENPRLGFIALFTTVFCYGTLWASAKVSLLHLPPLWYTAGRFAIGGRGGRVMRSAGCSSPFCLSRSAASGYRRVRAFRSCSASAC